MHVEKILRLHERLGDVTVRPRVTLHPALLHPVEARLEHRSVSHAPIQQYESVVRRKRGLVPENRHENYDALAVCDAPHAVLPHLLCAATQRVRVLCWVWSVTGQLSVQKRTKSMTAMRDSQWWCVVGGCDNGWHLRARDVGVWVCGCVGV